MSWDWLTEPARRGIILSQEVAQKHRTNIDTPHLVLGLLWSALDPELPSSELAVLLTNRGIDYASIEMELAEAGFLTKEEPFIPAPADMVLTTEAKTALEEAQMLAREQAYRCVHLEILLLATLIIMEKNQRTFSSLAILRQLAYVALGRQLKAAERKTAAYLTLRAQEKLAWLRATTAAQDSVRAGLHVLLTKAEAAGDIAIGGQLLLVLQMFETVIGQRADRLAPNLDWDTPPQPLGAPGTDDG